jgi:hypothetical protein
MMAMSRLPEGYEDGRFHLLALGIYVRLEYMKILVFCGLNKHGGTPPIAPPGHSEVAHDATRMMGVMYPPEAMVNGSGSVKTILATLGKGYLELPPEVTGYAFVFSVLFSKSKLMFFCRSLQQQKSSNEANWATDGESIMEDVSLFRYVSRSLLQLSSHVLMQLPQRLHVLIDTEQFLNSISMVDNDGNIITPGNWAHAPNAAHADTPPRPPAQPPLQPQTSELSTTDPALHNTTPLSLMPHQTDLEEPDSVPPMNNSFCRLRDHHLTWLTHCSTVAEFIPSMQDHMGMFEEIHKTIEAGTRSRRVLPRASIKSRGPRK